ncbi:MAG: hypothetical protein GYA51_09525 [Candidatus Methanofastidiosa archaeon]|jgi:parallel beta-helix repeat protein|nr:hypothetical protein [Candidatus Methanofastidiosa archaeon]
MKRIISIFVGILILISAFSVINPVSAATLEVGAGKTYTTIGAAMAAAGNSDTILVYPGTYNENVRITVPNLTLKSVGGRDVTTIGPGTGLNSNSIIYIDGSLGVITVDGFTVLCSDAIPNPSGIIYGFGQPAGTTCHILNNRIIATGTYLKNAIQVKGENSTVIGNIIEGKIMGYPRWGSTGILCIATRNLLVKNNHISGTEHGIAVTEEHRNGNPPGVYNTVIEKNIIENCLLEGIYIRGNVDNTLIKNNTIINNPKWGILEKHLLDYYSGGTYYPYHTGDPCNTKIYYNYFCNNGIDIESSNEEHHPNCKHCKLDLMGNTWCKPELPMKEISRILQKAKSKSAAGIINTNCIENPESEGCMPQ